jgi:superfamily II DNA or RNA helicase
MGTDRRPAWKSLRTRARAKPGQPIAIPPALLPPKLRGAAVGAAVTPGPAARKLYVSGGLSTAAFSAAQAQALAAHQLLMSHQSQGNNEKRLSREALAARVQAETIRKKNQELMDKQENAKTAIPEVNRVYNLALKPNLVHGPSFSRLAKPIAHSFVVGKIDFWRPYCTHRNCNLPTNFTFTDFSLQSCTLTGADSANPFLLDILLREIGMDNTDFSASLTFGQAFLIPPKVSALFTNADNAPVNKFMSASKDIVQSFVTDALDRAIADGLVTVRWESCHYEGAKNPTSALGAYSSLLTPSVMGEEPFFNMVKATRDWRRECTNRIRTINSFDGKNCCRLRAWISLNPSAFGSNNVRVAADLAPPDSPYSYHATLDVSAGREIPPKETLGSGIVHTRDCVTLAHLLSYVDFANFTACPLSHKPSSFLPKSFDTPMMSTMYKGTSAADSEQVAKAEKLFRSEAALINGDNAQVRQQKLWSIEGILSSPLFTVSVGYAGGSAAQPLNIAVSLRPYQLETLKWMEDQERRSSISDPFWVKLTMLSQMNGKLSPKWEPFWYCPLTGHLARLPPPRVQGGILSEEMGLGKTVEVIALLCNSMSDANRRPAIGSGTPADPLHAKTTLIVTPVSLLKQWEAELKRRTRTDLKVCTWYGGQRSKDPRKIAESDVCLTTYATMASRHTDGILHSVNFYRIIIDESTYVKGGASTSVYTMLMRIRSPRRWAVSGTPFANNLRSLEPIIRFLGVSPWANGATLTSLTNLFNQRLSANGQAGLTDTRPGDLGSMPMPTLAYILKSLVMRHVKAQRLNGSALVEMPPATGRMVEVTLSAAERTAYTRTEAEELANAMHMLTSEAVVNKSIITLHSHLRPIRMSCGGLTRTVHPPLPGASHNAKPTYTTTAMSGAAKITRLITDIRCIRQADPGTKFVIFSEFDSLKQEVSKSLNSAGLLVKTLEGNMPATTRGKILSSFAEDADQVALILSGRFAHGLTLTSASVVVLLEPALSQEVELQAVNRVHRLGQTKECLFLSYVAMGTVDERVTRLRTMKGQPRVIGEAAPAGGGNEQMPHHTSFRILFGANESDYDKS